MAKHQSLHQFIYYSYIKALNTSTWTVWPCCLYLLEFACTTFQSYCERICPSRYAKVSKIFMPGEVEFILIRQCGLRPRSPHGCAGEPPPPHCSAKPTLMSHGPSVLKLKYALHHFALPCFILALEISFGYPPSIASTYPNG